MNKIKILSTQEAQKIAAGEVVERPASVVKELLENSIDANSTQITLYIEKSGKQLIRILDNGCGMSKEDALVCFKPHSTSKISSVSDLEYIDSFGFRGEALGSISSVSKIILTTHNTKLTYIDGNFIHQDNVNYLSGLDLEIQDLFYNTPARKKFLKQDETEWNHILSLIHCFAFSNLNIHFKLYRDGKLFINLPAVSDLKSRTSQIFGHNFAENLIPLNDDGSSPIKINGLISNHQFWRYNKQHIFFFVNNRLVKNYKLTGALLKGYLNVLPPNKFPAGIVLINVDKKNVDINVHPRKEEVQFSKPLMVENHIKKIVKESLENYISRQISPLEPEIQNFNFDASPFQKPIETPQIIPYISINETIEEIPIQPQVNVKITPPSVKIIGQILQTYILIEQDQALTIVDQHAAHERILYEQFSSKFNTLSGTRLLFPEIVKIEKKYIPLVLNEIEFFKSIGIDLELFGETDIAIKSAPPKIHSNSLKELILEVIHFIEENEHLDKTIFTKKLTEHTHSHMACKLAIRAGDILNHQEMLELITKLKTCNNRLICVHGRPTMWIISQNEIEKKFKRKL